MLFDDKAAHKVHIFCYGDIYCGHRNIEQLGQQFERKSYVFINAMVRVVLAPDEV